MKKNLYTKLQKISILRGKISRLEEEVRGDTNQIISYLEGKNKKITISGTLRNNRVDFKKPIQCKFIDCEKVFAGKTAKYASHIRLVHKPKKVDSEITS